MAKANTIVGKAVADFLLHLRESNASPHTIKAYSGDLANFSAYAGSRGWKNIDHIAIRGFLSQLYEKGLSKTSVARSLAAVRSLYKWLAREGVVEQNPAKLVATPKLPKKLPRVPTIEEMNSVLDGKMPEVAAFPERDRLMLELLYGCGIRNSELTGINLDDIRLSAEAILIRGKGKKERYVPFGGSATSALAAYLPARQAALAETRNYQKDCRRQRAFARCASSHSAACLRYPHVGRGRGPARDPGVTRPRAPRYNPALHAAFDEACAAGLRPDASPGEIIAIREANSSRAPASRSARCSF
jgi:site-specific recombinase XerD